MYNPRLSPNVLLSPVENGYIAYDAQADRLHQLNPVAALITELCNGRRDMEELRALAAPFVPPGRTDEIANWIEGAVAAGLLVRDGAEGEGQVMDAARLARLASHLRDYGKVQPAFLCARRVVELAPDDADAWCAMAELAHIVGRRDEAREGYEKYLQANPDDAEARHILTALRDEAPPPRVPDACIQQLYKKFSAFYEDNMVETLGYQAPDKLGAVLEGVLADRKDLKVLDLGCGTGLSGVMLKRWAAELTGVDLSPEMVEKARARDIYDRLEVGEITDWLDRQTQTYDLVVACDTLIYFGDLELVLKRAKMRIKDLGLFAFSVERGDHKSFRLADSGRYTHSKQHIESAAAAGYQLLRLEEDFVRMEYGEEVTGLYAVLRKAKA